MIQKLPISIRLSLLHVLITSFLMILIALGCYKLIKQYLFHSVDTALLVSARAVHEAKFSQQNRQQPLTPKIDTILKELDLNSTTQFQSIRPIAQVINITGKIFSTTKNIEAPLPVSSYALERSKNGLITFETFKFKKKSDLRVVTFPVQIKDTPNGNLIQVATSLKSTETSLNSIAFMLWMIVPCFCLLSFFLGFFLMSRSLAPVQKITQSASKISIEDLSIRLPISDAKDELRDLSLVFNQMFERLEKAVLRLQRFTGDVSHELRTPIAVLSAESQFALKKVRSTSEYIQSFKVIVNESKRMNNLVEDLLLLTRAENYPVDIQWEKIRIDDFISDIIHSKKTLFEEKKIKLHTNITNNKTLFDGVRQLLHIAIGNILANAIKYSYNNSIVTLETSEQQDHAIFIIKDNGIGISNKDQNYIFEHFYRVDAARNRATGGFGIGLSLTKAMIQLHKGHIHIDSTLGKGSTFAIKIPLTK